jgi:hypothetical protein
MIMKKYRTIMWVYLVLLVGCGGKNTGSNVQAPGDSQPVKESVLEAGADLLQSKVPLQAFNVYQDGFHFYNGNMNAQMEAHHYVNQLNEDVYQAVIFDGNDKDAKLMGIEYIITEKLFKQLDQQEKLLWHSHHFEVSSGSLIAPGIPEAAEHELMKKLVSTYGKTIHTWHTDQQRSLPLGTPMIMMGFTREGQLDKRLLEKRDRRFGIQSSELKQKRRDIALPSVDPMANAWEKGLVRQLVISSKADSAAHKH